jgi:hypothetical protein
LQARLGSGWLMLGVDDLVRALPGGQQPLPIVGMARRQAERAHDGVTYDLVVDTTRARPAERVTRSSRTCPRYGIGSARNHALPNERGAHEPPRGRTFNVDYVRNAMITAAATASRGGRQRERLHLTTTSPERA